MRFPLAIQDGQSLSYYAQQSYRSCLYTLVYDLYCANIISSHEGIYTSLWDAFVYILPGEIDPYSLVLLQSYMTHDAIPDHEITELIRLVTAMMG
jgi:hypothetical protein